MTARKPLIDFGDLPTPHGAHVGRQYPSTPNELEARARLAEIMIPAKRAARWLKHSQGYDCLESDHSVREFVRAVERLLCSETISELVKAAEETSLSTEAADRILASATPREKARAAIAIVVSRK